MSLDVQTVSDLDFVRCAIKLSRPPSDDGYPYQRQVRVDSLREGDLAFDRAATLVTELITTKRFPNVEHDGVSSAAYVCFDFPTSLEARVDHAVHEALHELITTAAPDYDDGNALLDTLLSACCERPCSDLRDQMLPELVACLERARSDVRDLMFADSALCCALRAVGTGTSLARGWLVPCDHGCATVFPDADYDAFAAHRAYTQDATDSHLHTFT